MSGSIEAKLAEMGIELADPPKPLASYVGYVRQGDLVFVSGQLPLVSGELSHTGLLGRDITVEKAAEGARICAINILAQVRAACDGDLERIVRCVRLGGFVAATPEFTDHPLVINGASDFLGEVLGDRGAHARAAVGVASLPRNTCVEIDAIFAIR